MPLMCSAHVVTCRTRTPAYPAADTTRPQLGSAPAMAVFTSGLLATVRAICTASGPTSAAVDFDRDQVRGALAVGGDGLGQVFADLVAASRGTSSSALTGEPAARRRRHWRAAAPCRSCCCGRRR